MMLRNQGWERRAGRGRPAPRGGGSLRQGVNPFWCWLAFGHPTAAAAQAQNPSTGWNGQIGVFTCFAISFVQAAGSRWTPAKTLVPTTIFESKPTGIRRRCSARVGGLGAAKQDPISLAKHELWGPAHAKSVRVGVFVRLRGGAGGPNRPCPQSNGRAGRALVADRPGGGAPLFSALRHPPPAFAGRGGRAAEKEEIQGLSVRRYHYQATAELNGHLRTFLLAYNRAKRLRPLRGLTPHEFVCTQWQKNPVAFTQDPTHLIPGLYARGWLACDGHHARKIDNQGLAARPAHATPGSGLIVRSDRGGRHCGNGYRAPLHRHGALRSQSRRGECYDNAQADSPWSRLKTTELERREWPVYRDLADARVSVAEYFDCYNL